MINLRVYISFITLFLLSIELLEPSTNFVRIANTQNILYFNWPNEVNKKTTHSTNESESNSPVSSKISSFVYTCQVVEYFNMQIPPLGNQIGTSFILPLKKQTHIEILIPPKIAYATDQAIFFNSVHEFENSNSIF